jgi:hypothetical protein
VSGFFEIQRAHDGEVNSATKVDQVCAGLVVDHHASLGVGHNGRRFLLPFFLLVLFAF